MSNMAGVTPTTDSNAVGESRVIITSPEVVDTKSSRLSFSKID